MEREPLAPSLRPWAIIVVFVWMAAALTVPAAEWEQLPPLPEANHGFISGVLGESILIAGGTNWKDGIKQWLDRIWVFDSNAKAWSAAGRLGSPCAYAAKGATEQGVFFSSGSQGEKTSVSFLRIDRTFALQTVASDVPEAVSCASALLGSELWIIGGLSKQGEGTTMTNACHAIDTRTGTTRRLAALPVDSFSSGAAAACGGRVFVFGGVRWDTSANSVVNLESTFAYLPQDERWEALQRYPLSVRGCAAVALDERYIYIAGGYKDEAEGFTGEAFLFDTTTSCFQTAKALPYGAMTTLIRCGDFVYCVGGEDQKRSRCATVCRISWHALLDGARK